MHREEPVKISSDVSLVFERLLHGVSIAPSCGVSVASSRLRFVTVPDASCWEPSDNPASSAMP
jgi:hypothetical protein